RRGKARRPVCPRTRRHTGGCGDAERRLAALTSAGRDAIPAASLIARESSADSPGFVVKRPTPKEQPPRNLSGYRTAWVDSDALESAHAGTRQGRRRGNLVFLTGARGKAL